jgi:hypothetical protein
MLMHENKWAKEINSWGKTKDKEKARQFPDSSTKQITPR